MLQRNDQIFNIEYSKSNIEYLTSKLIYTYETQYKFQKHKENLLIINNGLNKIREHRDIFRCKLHSCSLCSYLFHQNRISSESTKYQMPNEEKIIYDQVLSIQVPSIFDKSIIEFNKQYYYSKLQELNESIMKDTIEYNYSMKNFHCIDCNKIYQYSKNKEEDLSISDDVIRHKLVFVVEFDVEKTCLNIEKYIDESLFLLNKFSNCLRYSQEYYIRRINTIRKEMIINAMNDKKIMKVPTCIKSSHNKSIKNILKVLFL